MGKHYCDYCDVFLTHDSVSVRKAHNSGRNHLQNVREYYQNLDPAQVQQVIDTLCREYDRRGIEKPRDLLQPAGSSFMTFGSGPLSGSSDRGYSSRGGPPSMSMAAGGAGVGGHGRYSGPPDYSRSAPSSGPYSRPPPNMGGGYPNRGPPPGYGGGPPGPYGAPSVPGPPPNMSRGPPPNGPYSQPPPRYGAR